MRLNDRDRDALTYARVKLDEATLILSRRDTLLFRGLRSAMMGVSFTIDAVLDTPVALARPADDFDARLPEPGDGLSIRRMIEQSGGGMRAVHPKMVGPTGDREAARAAWPEDCGVSDPELGRAPA